MANVSVLAPISTRMTEFLADPAEIDRLNQRIDETNANIAKEQDKLDAAKQAVEDWGKASKQADDQAYDAKAELVSVTTQIDKAKAKVAEAEKQLKKAQDALKAAEDKLAADEEAVAEAERIVKEKLDSLANAKAAGLCDIDDEGNSVSLTVSNARQGTLAHGKRIALPGTGV